MSLSQHQIAARMAGHLTNHMADIVNQASAQDAQSEQDLFFIVADYVSDWTDSTISGKASVAEINEAFGGLWSGGYGRTVIRETLDEVERRKLPSVEPTPIDRPGGTVSAPQPRPEPPPAPLSPLARWRNDPGRFQGTATELVNIKERFEEAINTQPGDFSGGNNLIFDGYTFQDLPPAISTYLASVLITAQNPIIFPPVPELEPLPVIVQQPIVRERPEQATNDDFENGAAQLIEPSAPDPAVVGDASYRNWEIPNPFDWLTDDDEETEPAPSAPTSAPSATVLIAVVGLVVAVLATK